MDYRVMLSSDHLRAVDLLEKSRLVTIVKVTQGEYEARERGKKPKRMPDVHFAEYPNQPLGCNSTNGKAIARLLGSTHVEDWIGRKIVIKPELVDAFGEQKLAIRVDPRLPKADPGPRKNHRGTPPQTNRQAAVPTKDGKPLADDPYPPPGAPDDDAPPEEHAAWNAKYEAWLKAKNAPPIDADEAAEIARLEREKGY